MPSDVVRSLSIVGLLLACDVTRKRVVRCRRVLYRSLACVSPASSLAGVPYDVVAFSIDRRPTSCLRRHSQTCRPMSSRPLSIVGLLLACVVARWRAVRCGRVLYRSLACVSPASSLAGLPSDVVAFSIDRRPASRLRRHSLACRPMSSRSLSIVGLLLACVVARWIAVRCSRVLYRSLAYFPPASSLAGLPSDVVAFSIDRRPTSRLRRRSLDCRPMSSRSLSIVGLLLACVVARWIVVRCRRVLYRSLAYFSPASSLAGLSSDVVASSIDRWPTSRLRRRSLDCRPMSSRSLSIVGLLLACVVARWIAVRCRRVLYRS